MNLPHSSDAVRVDNEADEGRVAVDLYLDLMKRCLSRELFLDEMFLPVGVSNRRYRRWKRLVPWLAERLATRNLYLARKGGGDPQQRELGKDWPFQAETMIGRRRLDNIEHCVRAVLDEGVPGDLVETGVWRGGASIFMRAILAAYGVRDRDVWLADSFQGLPKPDGEGYPADRDNKLWTYDYLAVGLEEVRANFDRYELLDEQVRFLVGWFSETLPQAPIDSVAVLRLDGDMYESTIQALDSLYPKLSQGGFVIVDDYFAAEPCRLATDEFRAARRIDDALVDIDATGVFWRRT